MFHYGNMLIHYLGWRDILGRPFLLVPVGCPAEGARVPAFARQKKKLKDVMVRV